MGVFLWILQILLALIFSITGVLKLTQKKEDVVDRMGYVEDFTQKQLYGIGILEILGALGLVLPPLTRIYPVLAIFAALGLAIIMVGAFFTHLRREEIIPMGVMNVMLFIMALFVAYGRWALVPV